ncbi:M56 family metallopeptidase [Lacinutrix cladophorae]
MEYLLKASAIIAIFYFCYKLFLQRETFFESNRLFLFIGLLAAFFLPLLIIPIYIENPNTVINISDFSTNTTSATTTKWDYNFILISSIYLLGVSFFLIKLILEFVSLIRLLLKNKSYKKDGLTYLETENSVLPFSFFSYIVYNPKQFNTVELAHIINHEKVHASQLHSIDILLAQLASIVFWFNPLIWFYKKEIQQNLEFIADKNAQSISSCKKSYEYVLLKTTVSNMQLILTNNFYTSLIKKRIVMLHKSKSNKLNVLKYTLVLPLLTVFLMSFSTKEMYVNQSYSTIIQTVGDIEVLIINKDFTDAALEKIKSDFKNKGVHLDFKSIERNEQNEIITIKIEAKSKNTKTNFSSNSSNAIKPIKITYNSDEESISIGTIEKNEIYIIEDENTKVVKSGSGSNLVVLTEDDKGNPKDTKVIIKRNTNVIDLNSDASENNEKVYFITKDKDGNVVKEEIKNSKEKQTWVVEEGGANDIKVVKTKTKDNKLVISTDSENSPLIFIDDKESTSEELEALDPNNIETINVLKGEKHTRIYGGKAKDGVIQVKTKK